MGSVVRGIGSAIGDIGRGIGEIAGGIFKGVSSVVSGIFEGIGSLAKTVLGNPILMGIGGGILGFTIGGPIGAFFGIGLGGMLGGTLNQAFNSQPPMMPQMSMGMMPQMGMPLTGMMGALPGFGMMPGMGMGIMPGGCYPGPGGMMPGYPFGGLDPYMQQQMMLMMLIMMLMMMQQQMMYQQNLGNMGFQPAMFPQTMGPRNWMGVPPGLPGMQFPQYPGLPQFPQIPGDVKPFNGQTVKPLDNYRVTSEFGPRWGTLHKGIDLAAPTGTPVKSVADGVVIRVANDPDGYGNWVEVRHPDGTTTRYAHLSAFGNIRVGQHVGAGTVLGAVGSTGHSTGPHLHFEVRNANGVAINPRTKFNI